MEKKVFYTNTNILKNKTEYIGGIRKLYLKTGFYYDGNLRYSNIVDGLRRYQGLLQTWHNNKIRSFVCQYKNDITHGVSIKFTKEK